MGPGKPLLLFWSFAIRGNGDPANEETGPTSPVSLYLNAWYLNA